jgi:hypothetical protein
MSVQADGQLQVQLETENDSKRKCILSEQWLFHCQFITTRNLSVEISWNILVYSSLVI